MVDKDYYRILEIPSAATQQEIRRAYRLLAHRYHPDKNGDSPAAAAAFRDIREAYGILSDPIKRENYHFNRWQRRDNLKSAASVPETPQSVLTACMSLKNYVSAMDPFRMNKQALVMQLLAILSPAAMVRLAQSQDAGVRLRIVQEIINATAPLPYNLMQPLEKPLTAIAANDFAGLEMIRDSFRKKKNNARWQVIKILLIIGLTVFLCGLIYYAGR